MNVFVQVIESRHGTQWSQAETRRVRRSPGTPAPTTGSTSSRCRSAGRTPPHRRDGSPWPDGIAEKWAAWASMPHCGLWCEADWEYARDTIGLAATAFADGAKVGLWTELRYREKVMGSTWKRAAGLADPLRRAEQFAARDAVDAGRLPRPVTRNCTIRSCRSARRSL